jgi:hypothetical protein
MTKLKNAGTYIYDFQPVTRVENDLTEARIRELVKQHLGIEDLEWQYTYQIIMNKAFVDLGPPDAAGITLALYNHDAQYSVRTYKKTRMQLAEPLLEATKEHVQRIFGDQAAMRMDETVLGPVNFVLKTSVSPEEADVLLRQLENEWWLKARPADGSVTLELRFEP